MVSLQKIISIKGGKKVTIITKQPLTIDFRLYTLQGKIVASGDKIKLTAGKQVLQQSIEIGQYNIEINDDQGRRIIQRVVIYQ